MSTSWAIEVTRHGSAERARVLEALLQPRIPSGISIDVRPVRDHRDSLTRVEAMAVARAVTRRQIEFSTGRAAARAALAALGCARTIIPVGGNREPLWPSGFIGSLTHDAGLCVAMVARRNRLRALGTDLTTTEPLDVGLRTIICTATELDESVCRQPLIDACKVAFSAKEALYKALFPLVGRFIGFHEVSVRIDFGVGRWRPHSVAHDLSDLCALVEGSVLVTDHEIVTTAWLQQPGGDFEPSSTRE